MPNPNPNPNQPSKRRRSMTPRPTIAFLNTLLLFLSLLFILFLLLRQSSSRAPLFSSSDPAAGIGFSSSAAAETERRHLLFAVASSAASWPRRKPYVRLWYSPNSTRAVVFLDRNDTAGADPTVPPAVVSADASRFPYTFPGGLPSAVRVARAVKEAADGAAGEGVRWFVFGDDDTVFFVDNLVRTLAKYDHERWFYVGANSESFQQNYRNAFEMAYGGAGFAISASLARALSRVFDSCLFRYAHLYGSDARVFACVAELGIGLTHEPGFHQVDVRGNLFGMLSAHPLSPLLSLHHLDAVDPIFPNTNRTEALGRFFEAVSVDPSRILQQTVCYDSSHSLTVSIAWGYAIQVYQDNVLLPDLLTVQKTFTQWRRGINLDATRYMFNTRDFPRDTCKRPAVFFLESVRTNNNGVQSKYARSSVGNCPKAKAIKNLDHIIVFSQKLELDIEEMKAMRRQCCDVLPAFNESMIINIRKCRVDELISMHS